jgi:hypothetical protein
MKIALALLLSCACAQTLPPAYTLEGPRILAIRSQPVDLVPDASVALDALVWLPPGAIASYSWSWCAQIGNPGNGYACAVPASVVALAIDPDGGLSLDYDLGDAGSATLDWPVEPEKLLAFCAADAGIRLNCAGDALTIGVYLTVSAGGRDLVAFRQLSLRLRAPPSLDQNPTIEGLKPAASDGGGPDGSIPLLAQVPEASSETYPSDADGGSLAEGLTLSWYVSAGALAAASTSLPAAPASAPRDWAPLTSNWWTPPASGEATAALVLRDSRGGVGWLTRTIAADGGPP